MKYSDLLVVETQENIETRLRGYAQLFGASPDTWADRSVPAVMIYALSAVLLLLYSMLRFFAKGAAFTATSEETLAEQWAYSQFGVTRQAATPAVFQITVSVAEGQEAADLTTDFKVATSWGQEYFLQSSATVAAGTSEDLLFEASVAGTAGNVTPSQISVIVTPVAGLTIGGQELYESGVDQETIPALHARCQLTFGGIGAGSQEFVQNMAIQRDPLLTKVRTRVDTSDTGLMTIYLGQNAEAANAEQVAVFQASIDTLELFQALTVTVTPATPEELEITGTVTCFAGRKAEAQEAVSAAIALWQGLLSYGDTIRVSDVWRKTVGLDDENDPIIGIFSSPAIDYVDLTMSSVYNIGQWNLTVLVNSLVFVDPSEG